MRFCIGLTLLAACGFAIAADPTPEDAFKMLDKMKARYRKDKKGDGVASIDLGRKRITDNDLKTIAALKNVRELNLGGPIKSTDGAKIVYEPRQITDAGLKNIAGMTSLTKLSLDGTNITDAGLKHLADMQKLQVLVLSDTKVTDEGMKELTKLKSLQQVNVINTKVTSDGETILKRWKLELKVAR